ncbi:hypothetical protein PR048_015482 [Dryococelus australis]|uniref:DUF4817 domain-containing protein n=1 Tax=Dryococelus australis TaxID=614101 RepID=A0ABQ9HHC0_9NEOP|nr:hypothetical protein PR048_015482 [Dryococelus australis]
MPVYSHCEQVDMVFMYSRANGVGRLAKQLYEEAFTNRAQPHHQTFSASFCQLAETGTLKANTVDRGRSRRLRTPLPEERILEHIHHDPSVSTRHVAATLPVHHRTVWRVLHQHLLYPYHYQRMHALAQGCGSCTF